MVHCQQNKFCVLSKVPQRCEHPERMVCAEQAAGANAARDVPDSAWGSEMVCMHDA